MEENKLRQYDFITAVALMLFSLWELSSAFKMPMKDSYGGVQSVWYVSPALLPLVIGVGLLLLGAVLLINSVRTGGAALFIAALKKTGRTRITEPVRRVLSVVLGLGTFIYLFIPRVDFYLSIALFLYYICSAFYPDKEEFRRSMTLHYLIGSAFFTLLAATGLDDLLIGLLRYNLDILALLFLIYLNIYSRIKGGRMGVPREKFRRVTLIALIVPLVLCPLFRYFLLVPLPVEGGIIKLMNLVYYAVR